MTRGGPEQEPAFIDIDFGVADSRETIPMPRVGFAEAYREGAEAALQRRDLRARQLRTAVEKQPKTTAAGRTQKDRVRTDRHPAIQVIPRFIAGRRVRMDDPDNQWRPYLTELRDYNPNLEVVRAKNLVVRAVSDSEMAAMLDERFKDGRIKTSSRVRSQLRGFIKEIDAACREEMWGDVASQNSIVNQRPRHAEELFRIAGQPDESARLMRENNLDEHAVTGMLAAGLFVPATFNVASSHPVSPVRNGRASNILEVPIEDSQGVLRDGRERFLGVFEAFGLRTSRLEPKTTFSVELTTVGRYGLEGLDIAFPYAQPPQVPLERWGLCEISD